MSHTPRSFSLTLGLTLGCMMALPPAAVAQGTPGRWEVEVHGGGVFSVGASEGEATLPAPGASMLTPISQDTRHVPSWYFGDGAALFNSVPASTRQNTTITPLDAPLGRGILPGNGGSIGGRLSYALTPRLAAEFTIDYGLSAGSLDQEALDEIEASRASFVSAFNGLLTPVSLAIVSSTMAVDSHDYAQLLTIGVLRWKLTGDQRVMPFITGGGGMRTNLGDPTTVTLNGNYDFLVASTFPFAERDVVTMRFGRADRELLGAIGGGFDYAVNDRSGLRVEARLHIGGSGAQTSISATPAVLARAPSQTVFTAGTPAIQFSNTPTSTAFPSSLSAPALVEFETNDAGISTTINVTAGWYFRF